MTPAILQSPLKWLLVCNMSFLAIGSYDHITYAAVEDSSAGIGFYVRAVLPENQTDDSLSYFDLRTIPGQRQELCVEVVNDSDKELTIDIEAVSASTNRNGVIDYKTLGVRDRTLAIPFSEIAVPEQKRITVGPHNTLKAVTVINVPEESYDGVILGGLVFTRHDSGQEQEPDGTVIRNRYSYVVGVVLSDNDTIVRPEFELDSIEARIVNYYPAIVHRIRNRNAAIAKNINLHIKIWDEAGNIVADVEKSRIDMAPNSVMPFAVTLTGTEGSLPGQLPAGSYNSQIYLEHAGNEVYFEEAFTLGSIETEILNSEIPEAQFARKQENPWLIGLFASIVTFILMCIVFFWLDKRRRKQ